MNELQYKTEAKNRCHPSETVELLFETAVVKIKADAVKTVAKQKALLEDESASAKAGVEAETKDPAVEQESQPETQIQGTTEQGESSPENKPVEESAIDESDPEEILEEPETEKKIEMQEEPPVNFGLCAKDVMLKEIVWGSPEDSVQQALVKMEQQKNGYLLIGQNGVLEGILSKSDLAGALSPYLRPEFAKWREPADDATLQIKVNLIMSRPAHITNPQTPLVNVIENMCRLKILCLPVVDKQGKVHGLITEADIFNVLLKQKSNPDISASGDEDQGQPTSDYTGIESTATVEPALGKTV